MTRFVESALRNSVSMPTGASDLPYWQNPAQLSSLLDSQAETGPSQAVAHADTSINHAIFEDHIAAAANYPTRLDFDMPPAGYRPVNYPQFNDFAPVPQELSQALKRLEQTPSVISQSSQRLTVKTPTGSRSMKRPGLAGAPALVNGQYRCQWSFHGVTCTHSFTDAKALNDHIRSHHIRGAGNFECHWHGCDKSSFPTANKLVRHVHSHTGYKPFPCPSCPQAFVTKDQLDKHVTTHTGAKDFLCTWPGCNRSFAVKHALDGHMNSVHLKAKKHICPHCSQAFDDSSNLSKHKKQVHNKDTGIQCPARHTHGCTYVDSRKDKMKEHCERQNHGLELVNDAHSWNMWVQRFKSSCKKHDSRRKCRDMFADTPMSHLSSLSSPTSFVIPVDAASMECGESSCNLPACLPCPSFCNDLHIHGPSHVHTSQHCNEPDCGPCDTDNCDPDECDPCLSCQPCDTQCDPSCEDDDCDDHCYDPCEQESCDAISGPSCNTQPCKLPQCRSSRSSTPSSVPATPRGMPSESFFAYNSFTTAETDFFPDNEHPFQVNPGRMPEYMFMQ